RRRAARAVASRVSAVSRVGRRYAARLTSRWLGIVLSLNRARIRSPVPCFSPRRGRAWIGRAACDPATTVIMSGHGARDLVLGCGPLSALARGDQRAAGAWLGGQVLA